MNARSVAVCVATWRRPALLAVLLDALGRPDTGGVDGVVAPVFVADNDGIARSAAPIASDRPGVTYLVEPQRGVASARNAALAAALAAGADAVAFVDDDEIPERGWLAELVAAGRRHAADVVVGRVTHEVPPQCPPWLAPLFQEPRWPDGHVLHYATTANVLVDASMLRGPAPFPVAYDRSGGEDTALFERLRIAGARFVWADRAVVRAPVAAERARASWLLRREYRRGQTLSHVLLETDRTAPRLVKRAAAVGAHSAAGLFELVTGAVLGRRRAIAGVRRMCFAAGLATGLAGRRFEEYR